jgi:tetratricopeptide (TPR) repeat protein
MNKTKLLKILLLILAIVFIAYGRGFWNQSTLVKNADRDVSMGRYTSAMDNLEEARNSKFYQFLKLLGIEDPYIAYNKGVVLMLLGDEERAKGEFKKAAQSDKVVIKENAIYNKANLIATEMDFINAAEEYTKALKIDPEDFKAKKNLERMRLGQKQLSTLFSPVKQEREERVQSLKLLPWGNKYRYSGNQKVRW